MAQSCLRYSATKKETTSKWSDIIKNSVQTATEPKHIYLLNTVKRALNKDETARRYTFGRKDPNKRNRTIMMVGETGTGKSALINRMVNYILGVEWEDKIRFEIIPDDGKRSQTESQDTEINAYEIFGLDKLSVPFSLTVIDTPGYGNTRGLDKDKNIAQNLYIFLKSSSDVQQLDAVCLVVKASQKRLSPSQKYIFDAILSNFGKNMNKNFMILITFSDWIPPLALSEYGAPLLKDENNEPVYFLFNNLSLQKFAKKYEETYKTAWDNGAESFKEFFQTLDKMEPQNLKMTENVLKEHCLLEEGVRNLESQIKVEKEKHRALEELQKSLEEHKEDMTKSNIYQNTSETRRCKWWVGICLMWGFLKNSVYIIRHAIWRLCATIYRNYRKLRGKQYEAIPETCSSKGHQKEDEERITDEDPKKDAKHKLTTEISRLEKELKDIEAVKTKLMERCYRSVLELEQLALKFDSGSTPQSILRLIEMLKEKKDTKKVEKLQMMLKKTV
ncbi:uncharacterized protein LOC118232963 [Anguilla anguilla]|uniref:uncharacterized protein LOC118232963 n=1 Tax=Anguilla anguilla TaxID=7936 RepID=UPI0015AC46D0|nr:uncharacterized protein LOC118232963 [Anguilla anguilla]